MAFEANVALRENGKLISGMGVDFRDLDNDGYPDIVIVALDEETFPVFRNTGKGDFVEVTRDEQHDEAKPADGGIFADDCGFR